MTHDPNMNDTSDQFDSEHTPEMPNMSDAVHAAEDLAQSARTTARDAMESTKVHLSDAYSRARETASETSETVVSVVMKLLDRRMGEAAGGLRDMSDALHRASDEAGENPLPRQFVDLTAGTFDAVADMIEDRSTRDVFDSVAEYGRTNPATFAVGSLLAGFAIGRLLTADEPSVRRDRGDSIGDVAAKATRDAQNAQSGRTMEG